NALSIVTDDHWKRLRSVVTPTFAAGQLKRTKPLIADTARTMLKNMDSAVTSSSLVNVKQIYGAFTMHTVIQVAFGVKVDSLVDGNNPIITHAKKLFSVDISLKNIVKFTLIIMTPKLSKLLRVRLNG